MSLALGAGTEAEGRGPRSDVKGGGMVAGAKTGRPRCPGLRVCTVRSSASWVM